MNLNRIRVAALLALFSVAGRGWANTITVGSLGDNTTASDSGCTLREAIANANAGTDVTGGDCAPGSGNDIILLPTGTIVLAPTSPPLAPAVSMTISGQGKGVSIIDGNLANRGQGAIVVTANSSNPIDLVLEGLSTIDAQGVNGGAVNFAPAGLPGAATWPWKSVQFQNNRGLRQLGRRGCLCVLWQ